MSVAATVLDPLDDRGSIEPFVDDWAYRLNAIARWVFDHRSLEEWRDLQRAWLDLRRIFGPAPALRLLDLAEIAELVPPDAD